MEAWEGWFCWGGREIRFALEQGGPQDGGLHESALVPVVMSLSKPESASYQVVCMKWGDKFPAADVNRLFRAVSGALPGPVRFYCVTDDGAGIDEAITVLPIPDLPVIGNNVYNRGWRKLTLFSPELKAIRGPTLYLDLDVVLTGTLEAFFKQPGDFHVMKDFKWIYVRNSFTGNTSVFHYVAGKDYGVYDRLRELGLEELRRRYRNEQELLSDCMRLRGELRYWPKGWCVSYKYDCVPWFPVSLWQVPRPPPGAKVVVFHGRPKPEEALAGVGAKWYRPMRPAPWLAEHL
ncbi:MAG: glycosyltransferase [Puniceicoccaceae bacterium]|nr:MAG: glycosyltransferase [Puniceicoccaceae bacterium]